MNDPIARANETAAQVLIESLRQLGLAHAVLTPGSRSTPLAIALAKNKNITAHLHFDERGAAFMALGIAKATRVPAAAVCTSGTAVANYLPAVAEASNAAIPLLLITADRPPELQGVGANQTIHQPEIFGVYTRWERTLPCPDEGDHDDIARAATEAMQFALGAPAGPVHINCPYREPLACADEIERPSNVRAQPIQVAPPALSDDERNAIKQTIANTERGIIIAGTLDTPEEAAAVQRMANALGWPLLPDVTSGLRAADESIAYYDLLLATENGAKALPADTVIHIGGPFVSKRLQQHLENIRPTHFVHVSPDPRPRDPGHIVTRNVQSGIEEFVDIPIESSQIRKNTDGLRALNDTVRAVLETNVYDDIRNEASLMHAIAHSLPGDTALFLGNSMPVRDADMVMGTGGPARVWSNRGASGIDGNIATALGIVRGSGKPAVAVLGDLAVLHDLNSLAMLRDDDRLCIVVPNNDGGGIFHFLPVAQRADVFDPYFTTPHGMTFEHAAQQFGIRYQQTTSREELLKTLNGAISGSGPTLIEVPIDRAVNYQAHRDLIEAMRKAIDGS